MITDTANRLARTVQTPRLRWCLIALLAILYTIWIGYVVHQDKPLDFYVYYMAAYGFAHGWDVYAMGQDYSGTNRPLWSQLAEETHIQNYAPPYRYPPLTALLVWPLTLLAPAPAAALWLGVTALAFILSAWLVGSTSDKNYGKPLALGLLVGFVPLLTTLHAGQVNGLVLLALSAGFYALSRHRSAQAAIGIAVGTALKLIPAALLAYLGWRRDWRALLSGLCALLLLIGLTLPLIGSHGLVSYACHFLSLGQPDTLFPSGANQSLSGFFARLLIPADRPQLARILWVGASLLLVVATAILCWPRGDPFTLVSFEFALIITAISLIPPYTWYHQYALLLIPFFLLTDRAIASRSSRWMLIPLALGYGATDIHGLLWHSFERYPLLVSMPVLTALTLWGLLAWQIGRGKWGRR